MMQCISGDRLLPRGWPRGSTWVVPKDLANHLYLVAQHHACASVAPEEPESDFAMLEIAAHAGSAVEFMAKSALSQLEPFILYAGGSKDYLDGLIRVRGLPIELAKPASKFKTINATDAVGLVHRVHPACTRYASAAAQTLETRNDALHLGFVDPSQLRDAIAGMATWINSVIVHLRQDRVTFWGRNEQAADAVASERALRLRAIAEAKVRVAELEYRSFTGNAQIDFQPQPARSDAAESHPCPACHKNGWLVWTVDYDAEPDGEGGYDYVGGLAFEGFECPTCGLRLDGSEVEALGIEAAPPDDYDGVDEVMHADL